jgi:Glyoxalase-like domain
MRPTDLPAAMTAVHVEAADPHTLAAFWATATGSGVVGVGEEVYLQPGTLNGVGMYFHRAKRARAQRTPVHLDLTVPWGSRRTVVERLVNHGATHLRDVLDEHPSVQWTVLSDPEDNLLCIAEHPSP